MMFYIPVRNIKLILIIELKIQYIAIYFVLVYEMSYFLLIWIIFF